FQKTAYLLPALLLGPASVDSTITETDRRISLRSSRWVARFLHVLLRLTLTNRLDSLLPTPTGSAAFTSSQTLLPRLDQTDPITRLHRKADSMATKAVQEPLPPVVSPLEVGPGTRLGMGWLADYPDVHDYHMATDTFHNAA